MKYRLRHLVTTTTAKVDVDPDVGRLDLEDIASETSRIVTDLSTRRARTGQGVAFEEGDVLFGKLRPYLRKTLRPEEDGCCSPELVVLRPRPDKLDGTFLSFLVHAEPFVAWAVATSKGVKMPRTDYDALGEFRVVLPSLQDQRDVAGFLTEECGQLERVMDVRARHLALLDERRASTIDQAFLGFDDERWPVKWAVRKVQVGIVVRPSDYYKPSGWPLLRGLNVKPGCVTKEDLKFIDDHDNQLEAKSRLSAGDVVVVRTGKAGAAAVVPEWADGANCVDLLIIRPSERLEPRFLEYFLNSGEAQRQIEKHSVGAIQSHFNVEAMKRLLIPVPPLAEQRRAVQELDRQLTKQDAVRSASARQLDLLRQRRRSLITSSFTGVTWEAQAA